MLRKKLLSMQFRYRAGREIHKKRVLLGSMFYV